jgi:hypothetical protein
VRHLVPDDDVLVELRGGPLRVNACPVPAAGDVLDAECLAEQVVDLLRPRAVEPAVAQLLQALEPVDQDRAPPVAGQLPDLEGVALVD